MKIAPTSFAILFTFLLMGSPRCAADQNHSHKKLVKKGQGSIDLNQASAQDFDKLPGVGPALAQRIVAYRARHGSFRRVEDLLVIRGIGPKKWRALRPYLRVEQKGLGSKEGNQRPETRNYIHPCLVFMNALKCWNGPAFAGTELRLAP